jgi:hypothetical protein
MKLRVACGVVSLLCLAPQPAAELASAVVETSGELLVQAGQVRQPFENPSDQQFTGPYDVVSGWPKPMSSWPGHEGWTWGSTQGIFAQNPDRIFIVQRGELRALKESIRPTIIEVDGVQSPVRLSAPVRGVPPRNASVDPLGSPGEPHVDFQGVEGKDYRWEHILFVVDREGNLVEAWTQWDSLFKRAHKVLISPYDPDKRVWVVDDGRNAIFVFSNDGKKLLQAIGTPNEPGNDETHFGRQTDIAWLPDGTFFVSDGYDNTRVVKFDKHGKFLTAWGHKGEAGKETRPNYFNTVHGIATDDERRVYVVDRANRRIQIFDENGRFLNQWYLGPLAATYHILMTADQHLWMSDGHATWRILKYDLTGRMLYSWGTWGPLPGQLWGVHQISVDQQGNLYTAEVFNGRAQKFRPKKGADPAQLVGQPVRAAWSQ